MIRHASNFTAVAIATVFAIASARAQTMPKAVGHWEGKIHMGEKDIPMNVDLSKNAAGAWIGTFTIPGSTQADVPLSNIFADDMAVRFTLNLQDNPSFEGKLSAEGNSISGTASNSQGSVNFDLARTGEAHVNVPPPSSALPKEFEGRWEGTIAVNGQSLRLAVILAPNADGTGGGTIVSLDQGNQSFPASTVVVQGKELNIESRAVGAKLHGILGDNGEITAEWSQGTAKFSITLKRASSP